jgi:hypothetical protein
VEHRPLEKLVLPVRKSLRWRLPGLADRTTNEGSDPVQSWRRRAGLYRRIRKVAVYKGKDGRPIRTSPLGLASKMPKPMNRHGSMESVARADPLRRVIGR